MSRTNYLIQQAEMENHFTEKTGESESQKHPGHSLSGLLAQCDPDAEISKEDREWINAPPVGKEIL
ncbi:hypothetical protein E0547_06790 [Salmonella enterica subsp. enterica]|nr:hypothetical protein [Salmonella enterica]ECG5096657.1 hypothetical protein [Salmonella enterica subsp. enterica]EDR3010373.1 hypothetical protein [Salmonella enterica subsp. enterica]EDX4814031.1 hypothetical protein [Salmonella enterica subsp. enterica]EHA4611252.1 hypothetical protein [Salmonella enterica]